MNRRTFLAALAGTPVLAALIAACGDDSTQGNAYSFPEVSDEIVLRIGTSGGFVPAGTDFVNLPQLLITGDGRVLTPAAITLEFPGPLVMPMFERSITKEGIEKVLELADDAALLGTPPDYAMPPDRQIADAPDTVVSITVNGNTYEHRATALGFDSPDGGPSTPARDNLNEFVMVMNDLAAVAGADNLGPDEPYVPTQYRFLAMAVDPTQFIEPSPTIVEWPADTGVELADAAQCAVVTAEIGEALFAGANSLTFFQEADVVYQLSVAVALPGDALC